RRTLGSAATIGRPPPDATAARSRQRTPRRRAGRVRGGSGCRAREPRSGRSQEAEGVLSETADKTPRSGSLAIGSIPAVLNLPTPLLGGLVLRHPPFGVTTLRKPPSCLAGVIGPL